MKKIPILIVLLLCCTLFSHAQQVYHNKTWGFSLSRPDGWIEMTTGYAEQNVKEYDFTEEQLEKVLEKKKGMILLLALSKRDLKISAGVIPTIKVNASSLKPVSQDVFLRMIRRSLDDIIKVMDDARYEREPEIISLNGTPAVLGIISFGLKHDGNTYRARTFIYTVQRKGHFIQFSFSDTGEDEDCSQLYRELAASIKFDKN